MNSDQLTKMIDEYLFKCEDAQGYWMSYDLPEEHTDAHNRILDLLIDLGITKELREEDEASI